jgi:uncharacterized membrane protein YkoI
MKPLQVSLRMTFGLCLGLWALVVSTAAMAGPERDELLRKVQDGSILPLAKIIEHAQRDHPGDLLEAELEDEHGVTVYELKILTPEGRIRKVYYDAKEGTVIKWKDRR